MSYTLDGDLCQMSTQKNELIRRGIQLKQNNVYPSIEKEEDYIKALNIIWNNEIEGWWNYKDAFIRHKICTKEEYETKLMD